MPNTEADLMRLSVKPGVRCCMHLRISLESGFIVEDTYGDEPICVTIGDGDLIPGLEQVMTGMQVGEKLEVTLSPFDAYGFHDDERVFEMPRSDFDESLEIEKGKIIGFITPSGEEVAGAILAVADDTVKVDFNHPLAGKNVVFDIEILKLNEA